MNGRRAAGAERPCFHDTELETINWIGIDVSKIAQPNSKTKRIKIIANYTHYGINSILHQDQHTLLLYSAETKKNNLHRTRQRIGIGIHLSAKGGVRAAQLFFFLKNLIYPQSTYLKLLFRSSAVEHNCCYTLSHKFHELILIRSHQIACHIKFISCHPLPF